MTGCHIHLAESERTKVSLTRTLCSGSLRMERSVSLAPNLPLLTEWRGASLGYRGHKDEQAF